MGELLCYKSRRVQLFYTLRYPAGSRVQSAFRSTPGSVSWFIQPNTRTRTRATHSTEPGNPEAGGPHSRHNQLLRHGGRRGGFEVGFVHNSGSEARGPRPQRRMRLVIFLAGEPSSPLQPQRQPPTCALICPPLSPCVSGVCPTWRCVCAAPL